MIPSPAAYLTSLGPVRVPPGQVYAYVLAGNGVWKLGTSPLLWALVPVVRCRVAGLPPLTVQVRSRVRVPGSVLGAVLADARRVAADAREAMYLVAVREEQGRWRVRVERPHQEGTASQVRYHYAADGWQVVCDLHSHHGMRAFFSATDDADEGGLRLYGVVGHVLDAPEVRLRVGV